MNERETNAYLRIFDLGKIDVLTGISLSEAIFISKKHPATFLVFSPKKACVSIGRFQVLESDFIRALKAEKLLILRRPRAGGQLLHTTPQIVFSSIMKGDVEATCKVVLNGLLMVLEQLGMRGKLDGFTGVTVGGRRICEYTISSCKGFNQILGVLLLDVDYDLMSRLTETREELRHAERRRLVGLVTSVNNEIGEIPDMKAVRKALVSSVSMSAKLRASSGRITMLERRNLSRIANKLTSRDWFNQLAISHPSLFEDPFRPKQADFRSEVGMLKVALRISEKKISEIGFSGSFIFYPEEKLQELEKGLEGCELSEVELVERISSFYLKEGVQSPSISPLDIAYTILRASIET
ncbi:MAG: lipoyl protein ligase domain-containing protein [Thermoproteota archaeon]